MGCIHICDLQNRSCKSSGFSKGVLLCTVITGILRGGGWESGVGGSGNVLLTKVNPPSSVFLVE